MNDRELLELAAKAAQLDFTPSIDGGSGIINGVVHKPWNPLTDDGDALRLAVKLGIDSCWYSRAGYAVAWRVQEKGGVIREQEFDKDPYAATRRAIVRAAAEAGKTC